jgi:hypothetical protein
MLRSASLTARKGKAKEKNTLEPSNVELSKTKSLSYAHGKPWSKAFNKTIMSSPFIITKL